MYAHGIVLGEDHINVSLILGMMVGGYVCPRDSIGRRSYYCILDPSYDGLWICML